MYSTNLTHPILDYSRIPFINDKEVKIFQKRVEPITDFSSLRTLHLSDDVSNYQTQEDRFDYKENIDKIWGLYTQRRPYEMWSGSLVKYLFAYSKSKGKPYYINDEKAPIIHPGLQLFCLLNLAGPLGVVGMEILTIDETKRFVELAYIEGGIYRGVQKMEFVEQVTGGTRIIHTSYYKSEGLLGKIIPYKFFHKKTVREFHGSLKQLITKNS